MIYELHFHGGGPLDGEIFHSPRPYFEYQSNEHVYTTGDDEADRVECIGSVIRLHLKYRGHTQR